jgi:hypothetical protein
MTRGVRLAAAVALIGWCASALSVTTPDPQTVVSSGNALVYDRDYPYIHYSDPPVHNDIARLQKKLDDGTVTLTPTAQHGYLEAILKALNINPDSQTLVFSKTSLQVDAISAATPRAIYFNDDTYVGWVQSTGLLEIVTMDADRGPVFYTVAAEDTHPDLHRETLRCLTCHDSFAEMGGGVPHFLFESTYDLRGNKLIPDLVARETFDETPIAERWGGWYVTGKDGGALHLGNIQPPLTNAPISMDRIRRGSLQSLDSLVDTAPYLRATSDIVALLVLDHQVTVHNQIIHANFKSRMVLNKELPGSDAATLHWAQLPASVQARLDPLLRPLVEGLRMTHVAPLPDKVVGSNGYAAWFQSQGVKDPRGRSLRQLDLDSRVFRYPVSFLIYSEGFDALPLCAREHVYAKLAQSLRGTDAAAVESGGSPADRQAAFEILLATKPEFARVVRALNG